MQAKDRIIVALDYHDFESARAKVQQLAGQVGYFKIGLELLMSVGPAKLIEMIHANGAKVFVDGKFNDIPHTIGRATKVVADLGADIIDVHASAGEEGLRAAVDNQAKAQIIAVTILTSMSSVNTLEIFGAEPDSRVLQFAQLAAQCGASGVVCSPREVGLLRGNSSTSKLLTITPGIRPDWFAANDQHRFATPSEAIRATADLLVIGRPITNPPASIGSSVRALDLILSEVEASMAGDSQTIPPEVI